MTERSHALAAMPLAPWRAFGWLVIATAARRCLRSAVLLSGILWFMAAGQAEADEEALEPSTLRAAVSDYVRRHPEATLAEVAEAANALLPQHGLNFILDWMGEKSDASRQLTFIGAKRKFSTTIPGNIYQGPCGERWVTVPALRVDKSWIDIVYRGEIVRVKRPDSLHLDKATTYRGDGSTRIRTLELPLDVVRGVGADGRTVLVWFGLGEELTPWWQSARAANASIDDPYPMLLIEIGEDVPVFVGDAARYGGEAVEYIEDFPEMEEISYLRRRRFGNSGLIVEYPAPCA